MSLHGWHELVPDIGRGVFTVSQMLRWKSRGAPAWPSGFPKRAPRWVRDLTPALQVRHDQVAAPALRSAHARYSLPGQGEVHGLRGMPTWIQWDSCLGQNYGCWHRSSRKSMPPGTWSLSLVPASHGRRACQAGTRWWQLSKPRDPHTARGSAGSQGARLIEHGSDGRIIKTTKPQPQTK